MLLGHVGRGVIDEADQRLGRFPAGRVVHVGQRRGRYQDLDLRVFREMDGLLGPEYAVFVDGLDGHWLTFKPHFTARWPRSFIIARMAGKTRFVTWNGTDLPPEFYDLPAGRYIVEAVDEEAPALSLDEDVGIEAALASYRSGRAVDAKRALEIIEALGRTRPSPSSL